MAAYEVADQHVKLFRAITAKRRKPADEAATQRVKDTLKAVQTQDGTTEELMKRLIDTFQSCEHRLDPRLDCAMIFASATLDFEPTNTLHFDEFDVNLRYGEAYLFAAYFGPSAVKAEIQKTVMLGAIVMKALNDVNTHLRPGGITVSVYDAVKAIDFGSLTDDAIPISHMTFLATCQSVLAEANDGERLWAWGRYMLRMLSAHREAMEAVHGADITKVMTVNTWKLLSEVSGALDVSLHWDGRDMFSGDMYLKAVEIEHGVTQSSDQSKPEVPPLEYALPSVLGVTLRVACIAGVVLGAFALRARLYPPPAGQP